VTLRATTENLEIKPIKRMDRREFFKRLCALSGTMVVPVSLIPAGCSSSHDSDNEATQTGTSPAISRKTFEETIDTVFSVTHETYGVVDLQLNIVADEIFIPEADQFSISLSGPESPVLEEGSYEIYNDNLGNIDLYLQPGGTGNGLQHYNAVFSLLNT